MKETEKGEIQTDKLRQERGEQKLEGRRQGAETGTEGGWGWGRRDFGAGWGEGVSKMVREGC